MVEDKVFEYAKKLSKRLKVNKTVEFEKFLTVKIPHKECEIEVANARKETYDKDSRKPKTVELTTIENDLIRRDFKIKKNQKVLIVEDVITTGKSSLECSKLAIDYGAKVVGYACIIDRSNGKSSINSKIVSQIELNIPTYTEKNLPENLSSLKAVKPGSRNL